MARHQILYWNEIPSVVEARDETGTVKLQLSDWFQGLIDTVAMRLGLAGIDEYLDQWHPGQEEARSGSAREVAQSVATGLESRFAEFRDRGLGQGGS